jgi:hypothetical protein
MSAGWYEGYRKFAQGESWNRCHTAAELSGWLAAASGSALCGAMDAMAEAGASAADLDGFLGSVESSIEDDHQWIRTGC